MDMEVLRCGSLLIPGLTHVLCSEIICNVEPQVRAEQEAKLEDAKENHGDVEVMEAKLLMAQHLAKTGTKEKV
jgi:hypothetical protein